MNDTTYPLTLSSRIRSLRYAAAGIRGLLLGQPNAWIHAAATVLVVGAGSILGVSSIQWCVLIMAIAAVWVAEALNTALELLCDVASPDFHPLVQQAKDIAAGAVLLSATGSAAVGLIVFLPYLGAYL